MVRWRLTEDGLSCVYLVEIMCIVCHYGDPHRNAKPNVLTMYLNVFWCPHVEAIPRK